MRASPAPALFLLLASLAAPAAVRGQGLGDAATRERQKRHKEAPARVYTNEDLESKKGSGASQGSAAAEAGSAGAAPADGGPPAASASGPAGEAQPSDPVERERHERTLLEAEWRMRFKDAREELARAEAAAWTEGYKIEFYNGQPVQVRTRVRVLTGELKRARQALAELEEEFRRTGLPPGWARE